MAEEERQVILNSAPFTALIGLIYRNVSNAFCDLFSNKEGESPVMKVRHFLALAIAAFALAACGPMSTGTVKDLNVRDWVGHSSAHLIQSWGTPHHDYPMVDGGRAIGYMFTNQAVTGPKSQVLFQARNCMINFAVGVRRQNI